MQALIILDECMAAIIVILLGILIFKGPVEDEEDAYNELFVPKKEFEKYKKQLKFRQYLINTKNFGKVKDVDLKDKLKGKVIHEYKYIDLCNKIIKEYDFEFAKEVAMALKTIEQEQKNRNLRTRENKDE